MTTEAAASCTSKATSAMASEQDSRSIDSVLEKVLEAISSSASSPPQDVPLLISELEDVAAQQVDGSNNASTSLVASAPAAAKVLMGHLIPKLFPVSENGESNDTTPTVQSSLYLLGWLTRKSPTIYLSAASRAVREEADRLIEAVEISNKTGAVVVVPEEVVAVVVAQLKPPDDDAAAVGVASNASAALVSLCQAAVLSAESLKFRVTGSSSSASLEACVLDAVQQLWVQSEEDVMDNKTASSTLIVRCCTLLVDLLLEVDKKESSEPIWTRASQGSLLSRFLDAASDKTDPLLQMSILDLLERLAGGAAAAEHCQERLCGWLVSDSVTCIILSLLGGAPLQTNDNDVAMRQNDDDFDSEVDPLLGGQALRVLSALCRCNSRMNDNNDDATRLPSNLTRQFHHVLRHFLDYHGESFNETDRLAFIDAVSSLAASSSSALTLILDDAVVMHGWLSLVNVAQPQLKAAIIQSVANVLDPTGEEAQGAGANGTTPPTRRPFPDADVFRLYNALSQVNHVGEDGTSDLLLKLLSRAPAEATKLACLNLMTALSRQTRARGARLLMNHSNFYDMIVSRNYAAVLGGLNTPHLRVAKYQLVQAICQVVRSLVTEQVLHEMETYLQQGAHFVPAKLRGELAEGEE